MGRYLEEFAPETVEAALGTLTIERLRPLALLVQPSASKRKPELIAQLVAVLTNAKEVQNLYARLDPLAQNAVQEATHDDEGYLDDDRFVARYGEWPAFSCPPEKSKSSVDDYYNFRWPTLLALFFPKYQHLPDDLRKILLTFVPPPEEFVLPTLVDLPEAFRQALRDTNESVPQEMSESVRAQVRETAQDAEQDLRSMLRLIEAGCVRVSNKKCLPTAASQKAVAEVLHRGDFYTEMDLEVWEYDPAHELTIKAFAWPMLLQASALAQKSGDKLSLTPAGRKALSEPASNVIRGVFQEWQSSDFFDEFRRIEVIKGQDKAKLGSVSERRQIVLEGLADCKTGVWFAVDDFFRFLRATDRDFSLVDEPYHLYIAEHYYGNLGYANEHLWEMLQGRYILALLFEYVATLGLIDVAYFSPQANRPDYAGLWGTDDLSCLSRYDGLHYIRINPQGAWCLGAAERYESPKPTVQNILQVLPNLEIVVTKPPLPASERLILDRFGETQSDGVWKLTQAKLLGVLEEGGTLDELEEFLTSRTSEPLPQTVQVFLKDQRAAAGRLRDLGLARWIECDDPALARMLAGDPQFRRKCHLAGDRWLIFRIEDEANVRQVLRRLGHILPPTHE